MNLGTLLFCLGLFHPDKIEKQGILLNSTCTAFGTKCSGATPTIQYQYGVHEDGLRLFIDIQEEELMKQKILFQLVYQQQEVSFKEPFILPDEVCRSLNYVKGYSINPGNAQIEYSNKRYRLILLEK